MPPLGDFAPADPIRLPPQVVLGISFFVLLLLPAFTMAGGGGIAVIMGFLSIVGVIGLVAHKAWKPPYPVWLLFLAAFLLWAWITQSWSHYEKVSGWSNAEKILLAGLFFPAGVWLWAKMRDHPLGGELRIGFIFVCIVGISLLFVDVFSNFAISFLVDPIGQGETFASRHADATRNISRGLIFYSAMAFPLAAMIWPRKYGRAVTILLLLTLSVSAWKLNVYIAMIAPWLGLSFGLIARKKPVLMIIMLIIFGAISLFFAPLLAGIIAQMDEKTLAVFPASWEHRLYMWDFVFHRIAEHPLIGHGFDNSRTYSDMITLSDGERVTLLSLHTHNAGLQIWLETGLAGAALSTAAILSCLGRATRFVRPHPDRAFGLCGFLTVFILVSSLSFGVWQFWWWGTFFLGMAGLNLVQIIGTNHRTYA